MKYLLLFALVLNVLSVNAGDSVPAARKAISISTGIKVYPNPASSYIIVSYELKAPSTVLIEIANLHGLVVKTAKVNAQLGLQSLNITLSDLSSGIYIVRVVANNVLETKKLIVY